MQLWLLKLNCLKNKQKKYLDSNSSFSIIETVKKGGEVRIQGFGTFKANKRAARTGVNPRTGAPLKIAAMKVASFKAGSDFKKAVKNS